MATKDGRVFVFHPTKESQNELSSRNTCVINAEISRYSANTPLSSLLRPLQIIAHWEGTQSAHNSILKPLKLEVKVEKYSLKTLTTEFA